MAVELHNRYVLGEFELDADKYQLKHHNSNVHLPELPFQVLLYLIERRERYVSRQELLGRFWNGGDAYEETLTRCISTIRTQLNDPSNSPRYIETRKKVGYRYIGPFAQTAVSAAVDEAPIVAIEQVRAVSISIEDDHANSLQHGPAIPAQPIRAEQRPLLPTRVAWLLSGVLAAAGITIGAAVLLSHRPALRAGGISPAPIRSLAVLPFKPLNTQSRDEYLELGMADALIAKLSNVKHLIVRPTSAVRKYASAEQDPLAAGREQGVDAVVDANVQRLGDRISVTVRLLRVADGANLWSFRCEDACSDVFAAQDSISEQIAQAIKVSLSDEERRLLAKHYTDNKEAYQNYLKGRYHYGRRRAADIEKAIKYFQEAIALDPNYALAHVGLADAYGSLGDLGAVAPRDMVPKVAAETACALELDETLAEAHVTLATYIYSAEWNWAGVDREYRRALELDPNSAEAHQFFAWFIMSQGRFDEALAEIKKAQELDPLSLFISQNYSQILYFARRYDEAIGMSQQTLDMDSRFMTSYGWIVSSYEQKGDYEQAFAWEVKRLAAGGAPPEVVAELKKAYAESGWKGYLRKTLDLVSEQAKERYVDPDDIASLYARLGDKEQALKWLEKACDARAVYTWTLRVDPAWDGMRSNPRFEDLLKRVNL
jgi:TolB-like protein/DNA-binding winged helix-turn-helix (wHTH) protein/Flp pilus assembly protein TadD